MKVSRGWPYSKEQLNRELCAIFADCPHCGREEWFDKVPKNTLVLGTMCPHYKQYYFIVMEWT